ncbi:hypothetical protein DC498_25060 [Terrimonas sp.]|uniref:hypothetical protein n=1 Tax=Terrimonas sp. TaxID=1914338 RepID=UPI000D521D1C|nr:hypothetical protein [Terrimonas sp.]PVD49437.1 hypothetical protein DC498_25060 [Terrimonas sp.]
MTNIIDKYKILLHAVPWLIENSGYKNEDISRKLDMTPTHFLAKNLKANRSIDEVEKILKAISNEDFLDNKVFEKCFPGRLIDSKQFEKGMGWK